MIHRVNIVPLLQISIYNFILTINNKQHASSIVLDFIGKVNSNYKLKVFSETQADLHHRCHLSKEEHIRHHTGRALYKMPCAALLLGAVA